MNFMRFMAQDLREYMAKLGVRTVEELVGRTDLLRVRPAEPGSRASEMDLTALLHNPLVETSNVHFDPKAVYDFQLEETLDEGADEEVQKSFDMAQSETVAETDRRQHRTGLGSFLAVEITPNSATLCPTTPSM